MRVAAVILGLVCILVVSLDSFETVILPRRVVRTFRIARLFYRVSWSAWSMIARSMRPGNRREYYLGFYGPLSLIALLGLWATIFILSFALLQWDLLLPVHAPEKELTFVSYLYMSGTTFFTLGLGDIVPLSGFGRFLTVLEAGTGLGFLALILGYVPVIYQTFSRREINISLLDARAGSPPSGSELLIRHSRSSNHEELLSFLHEWERWCAELLESHLSYPVLAYYRSLHERQSWLAALTTLLDACALILVGIEGIPVKPVHFVFALARHAAVDLAQSFGVKPVHGTRPVPEQRTFSSADFARLCTDLAAHGIVVRDGADAEARFKELRGMYEPFVVALAHYFLLQLPELHVVPERVDDWQTSAWDHFLASSPRTLDRTSRGS